MKKQIGGVFIVALLSMVLFACSGNSFGLNESQKIGAPISAKECKGKDYRAVQQEFERAGFSNIVVEGEKPTLFGVGVKNGDVKSVCIGTVEKFEEKEAFYPDTMVKIIYYIKE